MHRLTNIRSLAECFLLRECVWSAITNPLTPTKSQVGGTWTNNITISNLKKTCYFLKANRCETVGNVPWSGGMCVVSKSGLVWSGYSLTPWKFLFSYRLIMKTDFTNTFVEYRKLMQTSVQLSQTQLNGFLYIGVTAGKIKVLCG